MVDIQFWLTALRGVTCGCECSHTDNQSQTKRTLWAQNIDPAFWTCNACMHVCMIFKSAYLLIKPVNGKPKPDTLKAP